MQKQTVYCGGIVYYYMQQKQPPKIQPNSRKTNSELLSDKDSSGQYRLGKKLAKEM